MYNYLVELIGTFILVGVILMQASKPEGPLAIGLALAVVIYFGGSISGGHFNPAVSLASYMNGGIDLTNTGIYMVVQLVGAAIAFLFYRAAMAENGTAQ